MSEILDVQEVQAQLDVIYRLYVINYIIICDI